MKKIFKYSLDVTDSQFVDLPEGAKILTVQFQGCWLCLWAEVDPTARMEPRGIVIYGTGHPMSEYTESVRKPKEIYIGTVQKDEFVWHVYEIDYLGARNENS